MIARLPRRLREAASALTLGCLGAYAVTRRRVRGLATKVTLLIDEGEPRQPLERRHHTVGSVVGDRVVGGEARQHLQQGDLFPAYSFAENFKKTLFSTVLA